MVDVRLAFALPQLAAVTRPTSVVIDFPQVLRDVLGRDPFTE